MVKELIQWPRPSRGLVSRHATAEIQLKPVHKIPESPLSLIAGTVGTSAPWGLFADGIGTSLLDIPRDWVAEFSPLDTQSVGNNGSGRRILESPTIVRLSLAPSIPST